MHTFRLDYCGISILIISSFIPWIYYGFYCEFGTKIAYLLITISLGTGCIIVSMWDKFSTPEYRTYRARMFYIELRMNFEFEFI
jgi:adiponectin receptor